MNTRLITGIISFIITFGFSVSMMQFAYKTPAGSFRLEAGERENHEIVGLLRQDVRNGLKMERAIRRMNIQLPPATPDDLESYAAAVSEYVNRSGQLDASDLPQDFRCAWNRHMRAWRNFKTFLNQSKELAKTGDFTFDDAKAVSTYFHHDREISDTWREVLLTARTHTELPAYIY